MNIEYHLPTKCKGDAASALYKDGEQLDIFVCSECRLPHKLVWAKFIDICENCLGEFSSPFEEICQRCAALEARYGRREGTYMGWSWASSQRPSWELSSA